MNKSAYRKFKVMTVLGVDDFASMREVVHRRYKRILDNSKGDAALKRYDSGHANDKGKIALKGRDSSYADDKGNTALKGHDFSRADNGSESSGGFSP